jgi:hypothetical protein
MPVPAADFALHGNISGMRPSLRYKVYNQFAVSIIDAMKVTVPTTRQDYRIARPTALAVAIHIAECDLPSPLTHTKSGPASVAPKQHGRATAAPESTAP